MREGNLYVPSYFETKSLNSQKTRCAYSYPHSDMESNWQINEVEERITDVQQVPFAQRQKVAAC